MQPRWKDGSKGMLTVNAIFAGFSAVLLVNLILRPAEQSVAFYLAIVLAMLALYCFALAAEWITDALDEGKLAVYLRSMMAYNLGVVLILWSLAAFLWIHGPSNFWLVAILFSCYPWLDHLRWFLFASKAEKDSYEAELSKVDSA